MKRSLIIWIILIFAGFSLVTACSGDATVIPEPTTTPKSTITPRPTHTPSPTITITIEPTVPPTLEGGSNLDLDGIAVKFWHPWTNNKEFAILSLVNRV